MTTPDQTPTAGQERPTSIAVNGAQWVPLHVYDTLAAQLGALREENERLKEQAVSSTGELGSELIRLRAENADYREALVDILSCGDPREKDGDFGSGTSAVDRAAAALAKHAKQ